MKTDFKLNGVPIKRPSTFKISKYMLTKSGRLASGDMTADIVAKKRKFFLNWKAIDSTDFNVILDIIWETDKFFYDLEYVENNEVKHTTVYSGEIPANLHKTGDIWVWKDVELHFIER